jgi:hypothetical protein
MGLAGQYWDLLSRPYNTFTGDKTNEHYRAWYRTVIPASDAISVKTYDDIELVNGDRLLLPGKQDLPVICFRMDTRPPVRGIVVTP